MSTEPRILVCRPQPEADRLCASLRERGLTARALPTLDIVACAETPETRTIIQSLDSFDTVIVISPSAARHFVERVDAYWPQWPLDITWIAVGAKTASILCEQGLTPLTPPLGHETSEGVLALAELTHPTNTRALLVAGAGGRDAIEATLRERGAQVTRLAVYQRVAVPYETQQIQSALADFTPSLLVCLSAETLMQLCRLGQNIGYPLNSTTVLVPGPRVAEHARTLGFTRIVTPTAMTEPAILDCIADWLTTTTNAQD